ncbi:MAG: hypothetical protein ABIT70_08235 [Sulfuriferula sp.]
MTTSKVGATVLKNGARSLLSELVVPTATKKIDFTLDGSAWPANTSIKITLDTSDDGVTWRPHAEMTTDSNAVKGGSCSLGLDFWQGNTNANFAVRFFTEVLSATSIIAVGTLSYV